MSVRLVRSGKSGSLLSTARPTSDYVDNADGTITHTPTSLTWMRCAMGMTWTGSTCSGTATTYAFSQANALTGATAFAGYSDWRVPTEDELLSLVDYSYGQYIPAINSSMFPETPSSYFWSNSLYTYYVNKAWYAFFNNGGANGGLETSKSLALRLVRGGYFILNVSKGGTGTGTVSSSPTGINCGSTCSALYASGTSVTLTAAPESGSIFAGWSGACAGYATTCTVTMSVAKNVAATFVPSTTAPVCTISANPSSITVGGNSTLTVSCSPIANSLTWTGGTCTGTTGTTCAVTPTTTTTYTVAGTNAVGTGAAASATVTVNPCTYTLGATSASVTATAGTGSVSVTSASVCAWTATSDASWISITSVSYTHLDVYKRQGQYTHWYDNVCGQKRLARTCGR